ncbi:MAG: type I-D CRISPR-associated helicase Cas3' [Methanocellales archaeon]|nr:type I-D CRISPR-associated helicase Cas3' [Methanocellales archaeon]
MLNIRVSSTQVPVLDSDAFPSNYQPLPHQLLTEEVVRNYFEGKSSKEWGLDLDFHSYFEKGAPIAIINVAQTGAGKTLAASSPVFILEEDSIFSYPTNALIHDQRSTLIAYADAFATPHEICEVNRPTLLQLREESPLPFPSQGSMWEHILRTFRKKIICTNPDILYYSAIDKYKGTTVAQLVLQTYPIIVYDEFHLATAKQQSGILLTIALAKAFEKPKVFLFLSATPSPIFREKLETIGIPTILIQELEKKLQMKKAEFKPLNLVGEVYLEIHQYPNGVWSADEWISENLDLIREHKDNNPSENIVIILDSVYDAKYVAEFLSNRLDVEVGQVHGWMNPAERHNEIKKKVVVGSSAIEVGIDFHCHFLIFEAKTWSSFMQRLGRVARKIEKGRAIAIVPKQVYRNFKTNVGERDFIDRAELMELVKASFRSYEDFESYMNTYIGVEGKIIFDRYIETLTRDEQSRYRERLYQVLTTLTQKSIEEIGELYKKTAPSVRDILQTYRGTEPQFAIFDHEDDQKGWFPFKFYRMDFVLRRCNFTPIEKYELMRLLERYENDPRATTFRRDFQEMSSWETIISPIKVHSTLTKPNVYTYTLPDEETKKIIEKVGSVRRLGLSVVRTNIKESFVKISNILREHDFIALAIQGSQYFLSEEYDLPPLFRLHPLKNFRRGHPAPGKYSIAFGLDAIMLDSLIKTGKIDQSV